MKHWFMFNQPTFLHSYYRFQWGKMVAKRVEQNFHKLDALLNNNQLNPSIQGTQLQHNDKLKLLNQGRRRRIGKVKVKVKSAVPLRSVGGVLISLSKPLSP